MFDELRPLHNGVTWDFVSFASLEIYWWLLMEFHNQS